MKPKEISKLNKNIMIVIQALHNQKEYISKFKLRELICISKFKDRDPINDKNKIYNDELDMVLDYLIGKGSILIKNSIGSHGAELPIPTYRLSFEMFLLIEKLKEEDKKTEIKKTLIKDWIESKPEISKRLKNALLANEKTSFKIDFIENVTKYDFFKIRGLSKHSWNEFRRLTGNI